MKRGGITTFYHCLKTKYSDEIRDKQLRPLTFLENLKSRKLFGEVGRDAFCLFSSVVKGNFEAIAVSVCVCFLKLTLR